MIKKKVLLLILGSLFFVIAIPFVFLFVTAGAKYGEEYISRTEFNATAWKDSEAAYKKPYPRLRMIDDLLAKFKLRGMSQTEILALLGKPEDTSYFKDYEMVYWLGPERNFISIDSEWLAININKKNIVDELDLVVD